MSGYLTVAQVADELGFSSRTILRWIDGGQLEAVRLPGGRLRVPATALADMLAAGSTRARDEGGGSCKPAA
jgi:excisionase family DNA binding protein